jgi:hypothetical protein
MPRFSGAMRGGYYIFPADPAQRFFIGLLPRSGSPIDQPVAIASRIEIMADVPLIQLSVTVSTRTWVGNTHWKSISLTMCGIDGPKTTMLYTRSSTSSLSDLGFR